MRRLVTSTYQKMNERGWDTIYWAIDVHGTCIKPNYSTAEIPTEFYPIANRVLEQISNRPDSVIILYTCSHPHEIEQYVALFAQNNIRVKYVNENPEVPDTALGSFSQKFYFNILLEDKAGFNPYTDWIEIYYALRELDENTKEKK